MNHLDYKVSILVDCGVSCATGAAPSGRQCSPARQVEQPPWSMLAPAGFVYYDSVDKLIHSTFKLRCSLPICFECAMVSLFVFLYYRRVGNSTLVHYLSAISDGNVQASTLVSMVRPAGERSEMSNCLLGARRSRAPCHEWMGSYCCCSRFQFWVGY